MDVEGGPPPTKCYYTMICRTEVEAILEFMKKNEDRDHRVIVIHHTSSIMGSVYVMTPDDFFASEVGNDRVMEAELRGIPEGAVDVTDWSYA